MPAMISVVREINRPRYPTVPMRINSEEAKVKVWTNEELKLDVQTTGLKGSPTWVSRIFSPQRDKGEIIGNGMADPVSTARELVDRLLAKDLLPV